MWCMYDVFERSSCYVTEGFRFCEEKKFLGRDII